MAQPTLVVDNSGALATSDFLAAMRELASGVAVATGVFERRRAGCAVSAFASLSLDPPSVLVCLSANSSTLRVIRAGGVFALNVLAGPHEALARRFADPAVNGAERFSEGAWTTLATGAPTLRDALAVVDCRLTRIVEHATHAILIGEAIAVAGGAPRPALVHRRRRFEVLP